MAFASNQTIGHLGQVWDPKQVLKLFNPESTNEGITCMGFKKESRPRRCSKPPPSAKTLKRIEILETLKNMEPVEVAKNPVILERLVETMLCHHHADLDTAAATVGQWLGLVKAYNDTQKSIFQRPSFPVISRAPISWPAPATVHPPGQQDIIAQLRKDLEKANRQISMLVQAKGVDQQDYMALFQAHADLKSEMIAVRKEIEETANNNANLIKDMTTQHEDRVNDMVKKHDDDVKAHKDELCNATRVAFERERSFVRTGLDQQAKLRARTNKAFDEEQAKTIAMRIQLQDLRDELRLRSEREARQASAALVKENAATSLRYEVQELREQVRCLEVTNKQSLEKCDWAEKGQEYLFAWQQIKPLVRQSRRWTASFTQAQMATPKVPAIPWPVKSGKAEDLTATTATQFFKMAVVGSKDNETRQALLLKEQELWEHKNFEATFGTHALKEHHTRLVTICGALKYLLDGEEETDAEDNVKEEEDVDDDHTKEDWFDDGFVRV